MTDLKKKKMEVTLCRFPYASLRSLAPSAFSLLACLLWGPQHHATRQHQLNTWGAAIRTCIAHQAPTSPLPFQTSTSERRATVESPRQQCQVPWSSDQPPSVPWLGPHHAWTIVLQPHVLESLGVAAAHRNPYFHFTEEKIKGQRGVVLCPRSPSGEAQSLKWHYS